MVKGLRLFTVDIARLYRKNTIMKSTKVTSDSKLPVVIIGAGPIGLVAGVHLASRGLEFLILEKGPTVGHYVQQWGHVRMFSPWKYAVDPVASQRLRSVGWSEPRADSLPTGKDLRDQWLLPISRLPEIAERLRLETEVLAVGRRGRDRLKSSGREDVPLRLRIRRSDGSQEDIEARAVIDASGTWGNPKPLGASGIEALGELEAADRIDYGIPDLGVDSVRTNFSNRRIAVVGGGDSAFNALLNLTGLAVENPETVIHWILRGSVPEFVSETKDQLPQRAGLAIAVGKRKAEGQLIIHSNFEVETVESREEDLVLRDRRNRTVVVDRVVCATGSKPDLEMLRELRLDLDLITEAPAALGPLIDPNVHSCKTVPPHGFEELRQPEAGFFMAGVKSYGRAPTFLLLTGYEQVRSIVAAIAGDLTAARDVQLVLPESGVCSANLFEESSAQASCG